MTRFFRSRLVGPDRQRKERSRVMESLTLPMKHQAEEQTIEHIESIDPCDAEDHVRKSKWIKIEVKSNKEPPEPERGRPRRRLTGEEAELQKHAKELERALYDKLVAPMDEKRGGIVRSPRDEKGDEVV